MKKPRLHNFTPFSKLPRSKQRDLYVSLRWRIKREANTFGGMFTSDCMLDEPGRPKLYNQWFDFYFLGNDGFTIWNTMVFSATYEFWNKTNTIASEHALSLLSEEQRRRECRLEWEGPFLRDGEKYYIMAERPMHTYDCFGGLTLREYKRKYELEIIENAPPSVYESFKVDHSYQYGIGLQAVVQAEEINREVIEATIDKFHQVGEQDWKNEQPVPREALPFETQEIALSKVKYPAIKTP